MKTIIILILFCFSFSINENATNLRGYVEECGEDGCYASTKTVVELYYQKGKKWVLKKSTLTGNDGYFYFQNIKSGKYKARVNKKFWYKISVNDTKWQDLPVIRFTE